ncbi:hypothetical protein [Inquilinus limosus]|uniref:Uncharacterized protein n=2 Tax=Inquilinus limosus TaxID=171674 RepID=A0A211ZP74_9PROT|nr:hypothetical protein [Inquilinus limosus]KGM32701.1 hypothetical protein P409_19925 [Inquilinus limosus MP06]OWJ67071.1 hypothetical protein BWR60_11060 [Inquilinus limosus]
MKLNTALVDRTVTRFGAQAVPDNHPAMAQLNTMFGEHTFFLDGNGLHIVEAVELAPTGAPAGQVIRLASWADAERTTLAPHEPEPTDVVIELGPIDPDKEA